MFLGKIKKDLHLDKNLLILIFFLLPSCFLAAQQKDSLPVLKQATLQNCIQYAIQHNPDVQNAQINEQVTQTMIRGKLADWYPQINFTEQRQQKWKLPTFKFNGNRAHSGSYNTSGANVAGA